MSRCPAPCVQCNDKTCKQYYKKHWTCGTHSLHIGDCVRRKSDGKVGFVYDANPYGSKRSIFVMWDELVNGESGTLIWGHAACVKFEKINAPRTTKKTSDT